MPGKTTRQLEQKHSKGPTAAIARPDRCCCGCDELGRSLDGTRLFRCIELRVQRKGK